MNNKLSSLNRCIHLAATRYANEFVWQDVKLTEEFKTTYAAYLGKNHSEIEYFDTTAVITSSSGKYICVPNQWFVIASYSVPVCSELLRYKNYYLQVADYLGFRPDEYAKKLRDGSSAFEKSQFCSAAKEVLSQEYDASCIDDCVSKLWRFVSDYSWWSGQKTIDRGDFFVSVVLNMLNLVNASQGYVADIVYAYVSDYALKSLVKRIDYFTMDLNCEIIDDEPEIDQDTDDHTETVISDVVSPAISQSDSGKVRIKITDDKKKTIRFKG